MAIRRTGMTDLQSLLDVRFQSVAEFGEENIVEVLTRDLNVHNAIMLDLVSGLCEVTTDRQRIYGSSVEGEMAEVDEYGQAPTQRPVQGSTVAFPLRKFQFNLGWTRRALLRSTVADIAEKALAAQKAHRRRVEKEVKVALFTPTNYTFVDFLVDKVSLGVKALVNADSQPIPNSPQDGSTFDASTHSHYVGAASLTQAVALALIENVQEHSLGADIKIAFNRTNETAVRAFADFVPYQDSRIEIFRASTEPDVPFTRVDHTALTNRAIGILGSAEVHIKSWVPADYSVCWDAAWSKPLAMRQDTVEQFQGLQLSAENENYPLRSNFMEASFGIGVNERTAAACLYFANATYAAPTFT